MLAMRAGEFAKNSDRMYIVNAVLPLPNAGLAKDDRVSIIAQCSRCDMVVGLYSPVKDRPYTRSILLFSATRAE